MTDQEVLALLRKIDNGYKPTEAENNELSSIEKITWKKTVSIPISIDILFDLKELVVSGTLFN